MTATFVPGPRTAGGSEEVLRGDRTIVPRWECRWIDAEAPVAEARLAIDPDELPGTTVETYFVSLRTPHNVKVRHGELDIKRLLRIEPDGLEQWAPTLHAPFPLEASAREEITAAWGVRLPASPPVALTLHALDRLAADCAEVRRVTLTKHRLRLRHAGCPGELVTIEVAGQRWMSLAFEHEDPDIVRAASSDLGLDPRVNLNYPAALKRLFALPAPPARAVEGVP